MEAWIVECRDEELDEFEEVTIEEREPIEKCLLVRTNKVDILLGIPTTIKVDTGGYLDIYKRRRKATISRELADSIAVLGYHLYLTLHQLTTELRDSGNIDVLLWTEPYTEVKTRYLYVPDYNIYAVYIDTMFELGRGRTHLKEYRLLHISKETAQILDIILRFVESLKHENF